MPCKAKATEIWCGTTLVAFNAQGARALHARTLDSKPGRADLWLRSELEINAQTLGCSYVTAPIGSYDEQVVACSDSVRFRRNRFHERWSREGTRLPIGERRMLARSHAVANRRRGEVRRGPHGRRASKGDNFSFGRAGPLS